MELENKLSGNYKGVKWAILHGFNAAGILTPYLILNGKETKDYPMPDLGDQFQMRLKAEEMIDRLKKRMTESFQQDFQNFIAAPWANKAEQELVRMLNQQKQNILQDETKGRGFINQVAQRNKAVLQNNCTPNFVSALSNLSGTQLTERIMTKAEFQEIVARRVIEAVDLAYEDTSAKIYHKNGRVLQPNVVAEILDILSNYDVKIVRFNKTKPTDEILLYKVHLEDITSIQKELRSIPRIGAFLLIDATTLNGIDLNIADKENKSEEAEEDNTKVNYMRKKIWTYVEMHPHLFPNMFKLIMGYMPNGNQEEEEKQKLYNYIFQGGLNNDETEDVYNHIESLDSRFKNYNISENNKAMYRYYKIQYLNEAQTYVAVPPFVVNRANEHDTVLHFALESKQIKSDKGVDFVIEVSSEEWDEEAKPKIEGTFGSEPTEKDPQDASTDAAANKFDSVKAGAKKDGGAQQKDAKKLKKEHTRSVRKYIGSSPIMDADNPGMIDDFDASVQADEFQPEPEMTPDLFADEQPDELQPINDSELMENEPFDDYDFDYGTDHATQHRQTEPMQSSYFEPAKPIKPVMNGNDYADPSKMDLDSMLGDALDEHSRAFDKASGNMHVISEDELDEIDRNDPVLMRMRAEKDAASTPHNDSVDSSNVSYNDAEKATANEPYVPYNQTQAYKELHNYYMDNWGVTPEEAEAHPELHNGDGTLNLGEHTRTANKAMGNVPGMMECDDNLMENDTSDMAVSDKPVGDDKGVRARLEDLTPYGKDNEQEYKDDEDILQEKFIKFVLSNTRDAKKYMQEGKFNLQEYVRNQSYGMLAILEEEFKKTLNEDFSVGSDGQMQEDGNPNYIEVTDVHPNELNSTVQIVYSTPFEPDATYNGDLHEFEEFVQENDVNYDDYARHGFEDYFKAQPWPKQAQFAKAFLESKGVQ